MKLLEGKAELLLRDYFGHESEIIYSVQNEYYGVKSDVNCEVQEEHLGRMLAWGEHVFLPCSFRLFAHLV